MQNFSKFYQVVFKFMKSLQANGNKGRVQHWMTDFWKFILKYHFNQNSILVFYSTYPNNELVHIIRKVIQQLLRNNTQLSVPYINFSRVQYFKYIFVILQKIKFSIEIPLSTVLFMLWVSTVQNFSKFYRAVLEFMKSLQSPTRRIRG